MAFCSCYGHMVIFVSGFIIPFMLCDQITYGLNLFLCNNNTYLVISVDLLALLYSQQSDCATVQRIL